jgi:hypothetical protein
MEVLRLRDGPWAAIFRTARAPFFIVPGRHSGLPIIRMTRGTRPMRTPWPAVPG